MTSDRNKPGVAFWATVVVVALPLIYVLSFGPACWISSHSGIGVYALPKVYRPILEAMSSSRSVADLCNSYAKAGARSGWQWVDASDSAAPIWLWSMVSP
jgi:hypothetical protein